MAQNKPKPLIILVGAGGIGGFLYPQLLRTIEFSELIVFDKDIVEPDNLYRQNFGLYDIGKFKTRVLVDRYHNLRASRPGGFSRGHIIALTEWFTLDTIHYLEQRVAARPNRDVFIISAVDNHPARLAILAAAETFRGHAIIAGNNALDHSAYYYNINLMGTEFDPRVRFPHMLTDRSDDPTSCQSVAQQQSAPQTTLANEGAACCAAMLCYNYVNQLDLLMGLKQKEKLPYEHKVTQFSYSTTRFGDNGSMLHERLFNGYERKNSN